MKSFAFAVEIVPDSFEDGREAFHAYCPALRGCRTWGHSYDEAMTNIREAIDLHLEAMIEAGEPVPIDPKNGVIELRVPSVIVNV